MTDKAALLLVDVQTDFCPGGALPVPEGDLVVPVLNEYLRLFQQEGLPIFASRDWHPAESHHFQGKGGIWPPHCVRETNGAMFHPGLRLPETAVVISKGIDPSDDGYSAMSGATEDGVTFVQLARRMGIERLYVGGLATDYCVKESVLEALGEGFRVTLLSDAIRGVDANPGDSERAVSEMVNAGAEPATLEAVKAAL